MNLLLSQWMKNQSFLVHYIQSNPGTRTQVSESKVRLWHILGIHAMDDIQNSVMHIRVL